ncbi:MAG: hypothetical protein ACXW3P_08140, partial [Rhodospirillales bacterium]
MTALAALEAGAITTET